MHRFFAPPETTAGSEIPLPPAEVRHAISVLRLHPGDRAVILNGQGEEILGEIIDVGRRSVRLRVLHRQIIARHPCRITLLQAVPKARAMDTIVQKATELGASRVVPLLAERTVVHWDEAAAAQKTVKWRVAAVEAAKQCGAAWLPQIDNPTSISTYLQQHLRPAELPLLASLQPDAQHPRHLFEAFRSEMDRPPESVAVWVGPEGDFTPAEVNAIRNTSASPISLGPLVLRSETAALYCLAVVSYETQDPKGRVAADG
jgi:16S rRNA (uracil1498-N3)-methyltransferase